MTALAPALLALTLLASGLVAPFLGAGPAAAGEREDADWSEVYFDTGDGTTLHADVLRPAGMPETTRTPVVLTVSPYTSHSGGASAPDPTGAPPSERFHDFLDLTALGRQEPWEEPKGRTTGLGLPAGSPTLPYPDEHPDA